MAYRFKQAFNWPGAATIIALWWIAHFHVRTGERMHGHIFRQHGPVSGPQTTMAFGAAHVDGADFDGTEPGDGIERLAHVKKCG